MLVIYQTSSLGCQASVTRVVGFLFAGVLLPLSRFLLLPSTIFLVSTDLKASILVILSILESLIMNSALKMLLRNQAMIGHSP
jgi:hypothetical protein